MKFIANTAELSNALKKLSKAASGAKVQPILNNILIEAKDDQIKLTATNLDLTVVTSIKAEVIESGSYTVPAIKFTQIANSFKKQLTFVLKDGAIEISEGKSKFKIPGISVDEFPILSDLKDCKSIELKTNLLLEGFKKTVFAVDPLHPKIVLKGVYLSITGKILDFASTDGMVLTNFKCNIESDNKLGVIIPQSTVLELLKIDSESETAKISINNTQICIDYGNTKIISSLLQGNYPKYKSLIPVSFSNIATIDRQELISALQRVDIVTDIRKSSATGKSSKYTATYFNFSNLSVNISYSSTEGDINEDILCAYTGESMKIGFDFEYILKGLKVMNTAQVKFDMNSSLSAAVIRPDNDDSYLYLVMSISGGV